MKSKDEVGERVETKIYLDHRLRDIIAKDCEERDVYFTDVVSELLAEHYKVPHLAKVPRKKVGRRLGFKVKKKKDPK